MPAAGPILLLEQATRVIGQGPEAFVPLQPTTTSFESGQVVMICGPSGSGKTTLLSIMGCILRPTSGKVVVSGVDATSQSGSELTRIRAKHFGFIFQQYHLFASLSALGNIELAGAMKGSASQDRREDCQALLEQVGLTTRAHLLPGKLSGGEKQRVAIARALVGNPQILLCDEPTAALDTKNALNTISLLRNLAHEQGQLVVIVTHDNRLETYADRILSMEDGRIMRDEPGQAGRKVQSIG
jgi:putative ABC transport system ATP-binding protein